MVNANIDNLEMSYGESVSYIRHTNGPDPALMPGDNKKSVTSSLGKSTKNPKASNMWCLYCDKNNHNTAG
jgi:hypothetical protein